MSSRPIDPDRHGRVEAESSRPVAPSSTRRPLRVAIAGASGFVGSALASRMATDCSVIALGRRYDRTDGATSVEPPRAGIVRRGCDLFSVRQTREALTDVEVAVYLVHSMSPNARLTQGSFEDLDLLLADNFARAAAQAGVRRIVYLGGLVPDRPDADLSVHLSSRLEVERALGARGVPVTAVRAGLIVGEDGSSLGLLVRLVERLPMMVCPSWTNERTQPIALSDVVEILDHVCRNPMTTGRVCEVGGPDVLSYREMMRVTAQVLGRRRRMWSVPFVTPALSELWVSLVTGTSRSLVRPLIESLRHPMVASDPWLQQEMKLAGKPFEEALRSSLHRSRIWKRPIARSVQRFRLPRGRDAAWVGETYRRWLERVLPRLLRVDHAGAVSMLGIRGWRRWMLVLRHERTPAGSGRYVLRVAGGLLAAERPRGEPRLEFRVAPGGREVLAILQDYEPRIPWWLYACTQARLHLWVMSSFGRFLDREADAHDGGR